ncbi:spore coat protein U-like protein [Pseudomonas sp. TE3786]
MSASEQGNWLFRMVRAWCVGSLGLLLLAAAGLAQATCSAGAGNVSLGTISSLALITTARGGYGAAGVACSGTLTLLGGSYVRVMLDQATPLTLTNGGYSIPFTVGTSTTPASVLQSGVATDINTLNVLALGGSQSGIGLYFNVPLGPNVQAGTYTGTVTFRWYYAICDGGVLVLCAWERTPGLTQACLANLCTTITAWGTGLPTTASITLVVTKACLINTANLDIDFGSKALISQFSKITQTVNVTCTNNEGYSVSFDNGTHYQAPWRQMISGSDLLRYNLYQPNTTVIWNVAQPMTFTGSGVAQNFTFDATIDPSQPNQPQGSYQDSVIMTLNY